MEGQNSSAKQVPPSSSLQNRPNNQAIKATLNPENLIKDNSFAIFYENPKNIKLLQVRAGDKYQTSQGGAFRHGQIINKKRGSKIQAFNKVDSTIHVLQPKSTLITETLARKTQILYAMDNSAIIFKLDIKPGSVVIEAGTGSGSLSCAISETLGDKGHLYTFQFNKERAEITKKFFEDLKKQNITSTWRDVVSDGFRVQGNPFKADALFLDVPNPWAAIHHAKTSLKKHGRICCFSPCIQQVQRTSAELRKQKFINVQTIQALSRQLYQEDLSLQGPTQFRRSAVCSLATTTDRGHTGYLTFAISC